MNWLHAALFALLPVAGEVLYDFIRWWMGKDDKPVSTYVVRPILFGLTYWLIWWFEGGQWWSIILLIGTAFLAFFNPIIGLLLGKGLCYLGTGKWDTLLKKIPGCAPRLWGFLWLYMVAVVLYSYYY